ncbi:MAG: lipopolysaccharide biosynthesis protein [Lachnospiraceae bacterium]|nr:lipopolysaccharide biosynthesis protein [Lachnospiraceae bacterium]
MSEQSGIKTSVIAGFFWKAMESGGDQLITFFISIILARLLGPEKYGTMAIMLIFIAIAQVIIQNGFQTALIQKKEISDADLSSVFWVGLMISGALYLVIFLTAPFISDFFGDPAITSMLRVLSLILFSGSVVSVEIAIIARQMNFRLQCIATILADIISGAIGIAAAFRGLGTWALVLQQLIKNICLMLILLWWLKWRPARMISGESIHSLFSYGWKVLVSGLIDTVYSNLYTPFISRLYNATMVGYYNRANQFPQVIVNSMAQTLQAVMLPAFSKTQDERQRGRQMLRRTIKMSGFVMFPAMFGIMAVAEPMIRILLGEAWLPAVPLLRLCALSFSVWHMHVANLQAINANGRSDIYLKLEIIKKIAGVMVLILSVRLGITGMIFMKAVWDYVCTFINGWPNREILGYSPAAQWRDTLPELAAAAVMGIAVYAVQLALSGSGIVSMTSGGGSLLMILIQVGTGVVLYLVIAVVLKMESLRYLVETAKLYLPH